MEYPEWEEEMVMRYPYVLSVLVLLCISTGLNAAPTNLVPNGDIESVAGSVPVGWVRVVGNTKELSIGRDGAQSGAHYLQLDSRTIETPSKIQWRLAEPVPVVPGTTYRAEFYMRIDTDGAAKGQSVYLRGWYLDANRKRVNWRKLGSLALHSGGKVSKMSKWAFKQKVFTPPETVRFIELSVHPSNSFKGIVNVDSIRIVAMPKVAFKLPKGARAFDFTAIGIKPATGYTAVPFDLAYSKQKGFGWRLKPGQKLRTVHSDNGYPTKVDSAGVRQIVFICDLPNGKYFASAHMGGVWRTDIKEMNHIIHVDGKEVVKDERSFNQLMDEEYFSRANATLVTSDDINRPGDTVWEKYITRRYRRQDFEFEVRDGQALFAFKSGYVNGLIIFPEQLADQRVKALDQIDKSRQREFVANWAEFLPYPIEETAFQPSAEDNARGYVPFTRHWMREIQYASRPQPSELNRTLNLFATPGEYEPVTFSMWPLRDLKKVRITVSDLRGPDGAVLPSSVFRVWFHQMRHGRRSRPSTAYRITSIFLPDWNVRDLYKDVTTRCWLNAKLPESAKPGVYTGTVNVASENGGASSIPVRLRVLDFKLIRMKTLHTYRRAAKDVIIPYPSRYPMPEGDIRNKQHYRAAALVDLAEHGFKPEFGAWWQSNWKINGDKLTLDWDKSSSLTGPLSQNLRMIMDYSPGLKDLWVDACSVGPTYLMPAFAGKPKRGLTRDHIDQWLDILNAKAIELGLETIYLGPWGEESHFPPGKGFENFLEFHRHVQGNRKRWPRITTVHTCNTDWGQPPIIRDAGMTCLGMFHGLSGSAEEQVEMAQQSGKPFGLYGVRGRWVVGFYYWRTGAYATYSEFYATFWGTPNNDWDNTVGLGGGSPGTMTETPGYCNVTYSPERMIGSWFTEEMREGVDDHDYANTLGKLIERSAKRKEPAVQSARLLAVKTLSDIRDAVEIETNPALVKDESYRPYSEEDHDGLRRKIALAIERLNGAMRGVPSKPAAVPPKKTPFAMGVQVQPERATSDMEIITPTSLQIIELTKPITIDGKLTEALYRKPPQVGHFYDVDVQRPAKIRTTVHAFKDATTLYIGITCFEPRMRRLRAKATEEQGDVWRDDCVEVFLDPGHTQKSYYHFGLNSLGTRAAYWHPMMGHERGLARAVTEPWKSAVWKGKDRWTIELAIPLSAFKLTDPSFGLSVARSAKTNGEQTSSSIMPKRSFHEPSAFIDAYTPDAASVVKKIWLGHLAAGENRAKIWVKERPGASPVSVALKAPDGTTQNLAVRKGAIEDGVTVYEASYTLGKALGTYGFSIRAGKVPLGSYDAEYKASFFTAYLRKMFHLQGGDPVTARVEMMTPPGASLKGFKLRVRCLKDDKAVKETVISPLPGRVFRARFGVGDLAAGVYDLEFVLMGSRGEQLKRIYNEFEILSPFTGVNGRTRP
jgi:Carbohydrate family 9 binding domain-like/Glycoside hydrolase 123 N-terminal domain